LNKPLAPDAFKARHPVMAGFFVGVQEGTGTDRQPLDLSALRYPQITQIFSDYRPMLMGVFP
jgi:hypothetical protein